MLCVVGLIAAVERGLGMTAVLLIAAVALMVGLLSEFNWRWRSYVAFHDSGVEVSRYQWGEHPNYQPLRRPNVSIPYSAIVGALITSSGEIQLDVNGVDPPYELEQPTASVTFRPSQPNRVIEELRRRVPSLAVTGI